MLTVVCLARPRALLLAALVGLCAGCRDRPSADRYVPAPDTARAALKTVLERWKAGDRPEPINDRDLQIVIADDQRGSAQVAGQKLEEFEILGEVPGSPRCFAVRLKYSNPEAEERARYVIFGINPLWLYRQEDFDRLAHWEHKMEPAPDADQPQEEPATSDSAGDADEPSP